MDHGQKRKRKSRLNNAQNSDSAPQVQTTSASQPGPSGISEGASEGISNVITSNANFDV